MVNLLILEDGETFATGIINYLYQPATVGETTLRIMIAIEIETIPTIAALDTGAPYVICAPRFAQMLNLDLMTALERKTTLIRGMWVSGYLYRLLIGFIADRGADLQVDANVFIPDPEWEESWEDLPSFIGLGGCLERMRFAIDPRNDLFYFGPL